MNTPILETERLILRKFTEADMEALFLILKDEEVNRFLPWYPVKTMAETKTFYKERYAEKYKQHQAYAYAICLKNENFPIAIRMNPKIKRYILSFFHKAPLYV